MVENLFTIRELHDNGDSRLVCAFGGTWGEADKFALTFGPNYDAHPMREYERIAFLAMESARNEESK